MNIFEAEKLGLIYTGICVSPWPTLTDLKIWNGNITIARSVRSNYKDANFIIVEGSNDGWLAVGAKAIYGTESFKLIYEHFLDNLTLTDINNTYEKKKADISAKYEAELAELDDWYHAELELDNKIKALHK